MAAPDEPTLFEWRDLWNVGEIVLITMTRSRSDIGLCSRSWHVLLWRFWEAWTNGERIEWSNNNDQNAWEFPCASASCNKLTFTDLALSDRNRHNKLSNIYFCNSGAGTEFILIFVWVNHPSSLKCRSFNGLGPIHPSNVLDWWHSSPIQCGPNPLTSWYESSWISRPPSSFEWVSI